MSAAKVRVALTFVASCGVACKPWYAADEIGPPEAPPLHSTLDPCPERPAADNPQAQSFWSLALAVTDRGYTIVDFDPPRTIDAKYASPYDPEAYFVHWRLVALESGSIELRTPGPPPTGPQRNKIADWAEGLRRTHTGYACRDTAWLRARVEARGFRADGNSPQHESISVDDVLDNDPSLQSEPER